MRSRVRISDLLTSPETDPELAQRLRTAERMLTFAQEQLELPVNGSFTRYAVTGREAVTWNVVVAPEFSLQPRLWCFPVAGCVAYRGYFDRQRAERFAHRMAARYFDVMIIPAIAYSTLGWFEDPLLDTMLQYSDATLAGIMFHELAHERLYLKSDTAFNESFASFVEEIGVRRWLSWTRQSSAIEEWEAKRRAAVQFNRLLKESRRELEMVYASDQSNEAKKEKKKSILDALRARYQVLVKSDWNGIDYFARSMAGELNNAHLALLDSYEGGVCAFAALFEEAGRNLDTFYSMADQKAALDNKQRKAWLERPCDGTVAAHEL